MNRLDPQSQDCTIDDIQHTGILRSGEVILHADDIRSGGHPGETIPMLSGSNPSSSSPTPSASLSPQEPSDEHLGFNGLASAPHSAEARKYPFLTGGTIPHAPATHMTESEQLRKARLKKQQKAKLREKNVKSSFKVTDNNHYEIDEVLKCLGEAPTQEETNNRKGGKKANKSVAAVIAPNSVSDTKNSKAKAKKSKENSGHLVGGAKFVRVNGNAKATSSDDELGPEVNGEFCKMVLTKSHSEDMSQSSLRDRPEVKELIEFDHNFVLVNPPETGADLKRHTSRSIENLSSFTTVTKKKKKRSPLSRDDSNHTYENNNSSKSPTVSSGHEGSNNNNNNGFAGNSRYKFPFPFHPNSSKGREFHASQMEGGKVMSNRDIIKFFPPPPIPGVASKKNSASVPGSTTATTDVSAASSLPQSPPTTDLEFGSADFPPLADNLLEEGSESGQLPAHGHGKEDPNAFSSSRDMAVGAGIQSNSASPPRAALPGHCDEMNNYNSNASSSDYPPSAVIPNNNSSAIVHGGEAIAPSLCGPPDITQGMCPSTSNPTGKSSIPDVAAQAPFVGEDSASGDSTPPHASTGRARSEDTAVVCGYYDPRDVSSRNSTASFFLDTENNVEVVCTEEEYNRRREVGSAPVVILGKGDESQKDWACPESLEFGFDINEELLAAASLSMEQTLAKLPSSGVFMAGVMPSDTPLSHMDGAIVSFGESLGPVSAQANYPAVMPIAYGRGVTWAEIVAAASSPGSPEMPPLPSSSSHTPILDEGPTSSGRSTPVVAVQEEGMGGDAMPTPPFPPTSAYLNYLELVTLVASAWQATQDDLKTNVAVMYAATTPPMKSSSRTAKT